MEDGPKGHAYGDIYVKLLRGTKATQHTTRGSLHRSRRRGRTNVRTHSRGRAATDPGRGRHDVPCRSQDGHSLGEGREADVNPHAWGAPALPGDRGSCTARGYSAAAFRVASCLLRMAQEGGALFVPLAMPVAELVRSMGVGPSGRGQFRASDHGGVLDTGAGGAHRAGTGPEKFRGTQFLGGSHDARSRAGRPCTTRGCAPGIGLGALESSPGPRGDTGSAGRGLRGLRAQ
jgi:hypothetical protein